MIYFKGDVVKTKSGESAEIVDSWGIARDWYKLRTSDGELILTMSSNIDSLIRRHSNKKMGRRSK